MIDKIKSTISEVTEAIKTQSTQLGAGAKEKTLEVIEDWLRIFPDLQKYGLETKSFSFTLGISPSVVADLQGKHSDFSPEVIQELLANNPNSAPIRMVLSTIKTTYRLHERTEAKLIEPLIVQIKIKLAPEVNVFLGKPLVI